MSATECLLQLYDERHELEDYQSGVPRWCTGCGDNAILAAVQRLCRDEGRKVSSMHLRFLQPLPGGIKEIMQRFGKVMTIEGNWCDRPEDEIIDQSNRRYSALALLLRARYLIDVDCWSEVKGQPIKPATIRDVIRRKLAKPKKS